VKHKSDSDDDGFVGIDKREKVAPKGPTGTCNMNSNRKCMGVIAVTFGLLIIVLAVLLLIYTGKISKGIKLQMDTID